MRPIAAFVALLLAAAGQAGAAEPTRYLELINRADDSMTSLAIAPAGSDAFTDKAIDAALPGGGNAMTIELTGEPCTYDLRFGFRNGRTMVYRDVDVCNARSLRIERFAVAKRRAADTRTPVARAEPPAP